MEYKYNIYIYVYIYIYRIPLDHFLLLQSIPNCVSCLDQFSAMSLSWGVLYTGGDSLEEPACAPVSFAVVLTKDLWFWAQVEL